MTWSERRTRPLLRGGLMPARERHVLRPIGPLMGLSGALGVPCLAECPSCRGSSRFVLGTLRLCSAACTVSISGSHVKPLSFTTLSCRMISLASRRLMALVTILTTCASDFRLTTTMAPSVRTPMLVASSSLCLVALLLSSTTLRATIWCLGGHCESTCLASMGA